jgi:hypothetical protein
MKRAAARRQHAVVGHRGLGEDDGARLAHPRRRRRIGAAGVMSLAAVPSGTGTPLVAMFSLMVIGTPSSAPCGLPACQRFSDALAALRAPSKSGA